jgi:hypothetical protein
LSDDIGGTLRFSQHADVDHETTKIEARETFLDKLDLLSLGIQCANEEDRSVHCGSAAIPC